MSNFFKKNPSQGANPPLLFGNAPGQGGAQPPAFNPYQATVNVFGGPSASTTTPSSNPPPTIPKIGATSNNPFQTSVNVTGSASTTQPSTTSYGASQPSTTTSYGTSQPSTTSYGASQSSTPSYGSSQPGSNPSYTGFTNSPLPEQSERRDTSTQSQQYPHSHYGGPASTAAPSQQASGTYASGGSYNNNSGSYNRPTGTSQFSGSQPASTTPSYSSQFSESKPSEISSYEPSGDSSALRQQIQTEKQNYELLQRKYNKAIEEREITMREVSHLKLQIENEISKNILLTKENAAFGEDLNQARMLLNNETLAHKKSAAEYYKVNELVGKLRTELESERNSRSELKKEYDSLFTKSQEEKNRQHILLDEILTLKAQVAGSSTEKTKIVTQLQQTEASYNTLKDSFDKLKAKLDETSTKYEALEKRKQDFENLGAFSESLMKSVPAFQTKVDELASKLGTVSISADGSSAPVVAGDNSKVIEAVSALKGDIEKQHEKQVALFQTVLSSLTGIHKKLSAKKDAESDT